MENWSIYNKIGDFDLIRQLFGVNSITARLLVNRGLKAEKEIRDYLYPDVELFGSPLLMKDMKKACDILEEKINTGKRIRIIGDYDVDGIISTYILLDILESLGASVDYRIPERIRDGYGINDSMVHEAKSAGIDTILTCDNGISAVAQAELCKALGITMLITDHHDIPPVIPDAEAVIDIKQSDDGYPYSNICGAVVSAKLAEALYEQMTGESFDKLRYIEYMAMATICDVMELTGENRNIVKLGMKRLAGTSNTGLRELMKLCELNMEELSEYHVGYILGPCFNATGRLDVADTALKLLLAKDSEEAVKLAAICKRLNDERKQMTKQQEELACGIIEAEGLDKDMVLVIQIHGCHESLTGIIAGRIREKYNKPTIVLTDGIDCVKGSARSTDTYNIFEELCKCDELLIKYGGHPMAAGMSLLPDNVNRLRERLNGLCVLTERDIAGKVLIDATVPFYIFDEAAVNELKLLEPFGKGNEKPLFAEKKLLIRRISFVGKTAQYLRMTLREENGWEFQALYFKNAQDITGEMKEYYGDAAVLKAMSGDGNDMLITAAYYPQINDYRGNRSIQMIIKNIRFEAGNPSEIV